MTTPMSNPIAWVEIYTDDLQRAQQFYEGVFQFTLTPIPSPKEGVQMLAFPMNDGGYGANGALAKMEGVSPAPGGTLAYFACADCANELSRVEQFGGQIVAGKFSIGEYGFIAIINDSEGNIIGLHSNT